MSLKTINRKIAGRSTLIVGSMGCVYVFLAWSLLPLAFPKTQSMVFYVSGGIIQLVLLPLIMVGGSVLNAKSERRAEKDHQMITAELNEIKTMKADLNDIIQSQREILTKLG